MVGQEHVVRTLRNAVEQDRVHHAYLFVGSRGTGKTSMAKILARCLNCERGGPTTDAVRRVRVVRGDRRRDLARRDRDGRRLEPLRGRHPRSARAGRLRARGSGRWKVYIIDEAHMLTREAWNAFLKTLEEPPPNTVFVLATTEAHKVMPTIVDRCQRFDFQRPSLGQIAEVLERVAGSEGIEIADGAASRDRPRGERQLPRRARHARPARRLRRRARWRRDDVLAVLGVADAELIFGAADAIAEGDGRSALETVDRLARSGRDVVAVHPRSGRSPAPAARRPDRRRRFPTRSPSRRNTRSAFAARRSGSARRRSCARSTSCRRH